MFSQCFSAFFFFVTFNVVLSDSPISEQISGDGPLLERVARLEVKMEFVEKEIDVVKEVIADNVAEIKKVLGPLNEIMGSMSEDFEKLRGSVQNTTHEVSGTKHVPRVAFTAYTPAIRRLASGKTIVFNKVLFNEGNGYNSSTGEFTAPADGLYLFSVHTCNAERRTVAYGIVHEGTYIAYSVQMDNEQSCSSANVLRNMRVGQKLFVKTTHASELEEDEWRRETFLGVLLR